MRLQTEHRRSAIDLCVTSLDDTKSGPADNKCVTSLAVTNQADFKSETEHDVSEWMRERIEHGAYKVKVITDGILAATPSILSIIHSSVTNQIGQGGVLVLMRLARYGLTKLNLRYHSLVVCVQIRNLLAERTGCIM